MNTAKELFLSLREKARKAELAKQQLEELKTMAAKCTPVMHLAPSGGGGESRTMENNVLRIEAAEKELQAIIDDYYATKLKVMELIRALDAEFQQVMQLRYVDGLHWDVIAAKLPACLTTVHKIDRIAMKQLEEIVKIAHENAH